MGHEEIHRLLSGRRGVCRARLLGRAHLHAGLVVHRRVGRDEAEDWIFWHKRGRACGDIQRSCNGRNIKRQYNYDRDRNSYPWREQDINSF